MIWWNGWYPRNVAKRSIDYMKELGMGNDRYVLIDVDHGEKRIDAREAVAGVKPFGK